MGLSICQSCGFEQASWSGKCPTCGGTEIIKVAAKTDKMLEKVIDGRYKIVKKLGQGGMGAVYLAESVGIGQRVALKFLKSDLSQDPDLVRRFRTEAKSYALVEHPNAVMLHDFRQDEEGSLYISMEFCEGADLKKVLNEERHLSLADAAEVALQTAEVLGYAHGKGVVHRDLKPENIMIRRGMRGVHVKVLDFGIARLAGNSTAVTMQGSIAGTPRYMAPEQVEGKPIDHRIDVYSLGIVLFELLTGVQPFDGQTIAEILRAQVTRPTPHLTEIDPSLDLPEVDAVIQRATAKNRDERFPDMATFASALAAALPTATTIPAFGVSTVGGTAGGLGTGTAGPGAPTGELDGTYIRPSGEVSVYAAEPPSAPAAPVPAGPAASASPASEKETAVELASPRRSGLRWGLVGAVVAVSGAVAWFSLRPTPLEEPAHFQVAQPAPTGPMAPPVPVPVPAPPGADPEATHHERAVDYLTRATTAFKAAEFPTAKIYLADAPDDPVISPQVAELKRAIESLERKLAQAQGLSARGDCAAAMRLFDEVLKVNANVREATSGRSQCKQATPPSTIE